MTSPVIMSPRTQDDIISEARQISPHIDRLCRDHGDDLDRLLRGDADTIITAAEEDLTEAFEVITQEDEIKAAIRRYRIRINHAVVMTDLLGVASVGDHLVWLSHAARIAVAGTADWLTRQHKTAGLDSGWFLLALGKLGADELNYSSDIDLIVITLPEAGENHADYIRLTRRLTNILSQPTAEGIGWRVDLRLRPDPGATPVAISRDAAISYYESLARTWERAAFIRAIPVAGNIAAGHEFLNEIKPFLWRRYLDYTVLEDMRVMLRREARPPDLLGFNIKNGEGGIRSIEFFVHVQQLIAAGREKGLQQRQTRDALHALAAANWISDEDRDALAAAYLAWRRLEHRLQMIGDVQTHQLPKSIEQTEALARFCGHEDVTSFRHAITSLSDEVSSRTASLMDRIGGDSDDSVIGSWLEGQDEHAAALIDHLAGMGYENPKGMTQVMQGWIAGRTNATRSERARTVFKRLLPKLLTLFAESEQPDTSFGQFSRLMEALPSGVQLLSLLESNTELASTVTMVLASAPELGEQLARHPMIVDNLMYAEYWQADIDWQARKTDLEKDLANARDYEDKLEILRRTSQQWTFATALHLLTSTIDSDKAGQEFSHIAEILIRAIIPHVEDHMAERHGRVDTGGLVVLALGRLGAVEMTYKSDLDLIFVYEAEPDAVSDGGRPLPASVWYTRFGQQLISALTAQTAEGRCYNVDMRLRPSGNTGPVAIHIDGFEQYQLNEAWVWEHMALLKARPIGGLRHEMLEKKVTEIIGRAVRKPRKRSVILSEVSEMRQRLKKHFRPQGPHDLRNREGGLMDFDFLIQSLQLMPQSSGQPICHASRDAIPQLIDAGLLDDKMAEALTISANKLNALHHWMRLTMPEWRVVPDAATPLPKPFQERFGLARLADLNADVDAAAAPVITALETLLASAADEASGRS